MNFIDYLKEKWLTYVFITACFIFQFTVYRLDTKFTVSESNAVYIMVGLVLLFVGFVVVDYTVLSLRIRKFKRYCDLNASSEEDLDLFEYPMDRLYAENLQSIVMEFERYKTDMRNQASEELDFITKWVHDVKVPISSLRLIVESHDKDLCRSFYERMDTEIAAIEQSTQKVFYHIKSNNFYSDYKIAEVDTKKLIVGALRGYASFFSYKKINILISGDNYRVLTDEKWSEYIISQIISNAVKHTPISGNININTSKKDKETTIKIKNSGKGVLPKDIGQIFNKAYTSSEDRSGMKATGYGLYLSKKLSDMMGHKLTVKSEYGEYAEFSFTFIEGDTIYHVTKM